MGGDGRGKAHIHPAGVSFDRCIQVFFYLGKGYYLVELAFYLRSGHAKDCAVQVDVLPPGQFRMKTCSHLQEAGYPALDCNPSG